MQTLEDTQNFTQGAIVWIRFQKEPRAAWWRLAWVCARTEAKETVRSFCCSVGGSAYQFLNITGDRPVLGGSRVRHFPH